MHINNAGTSVYKQTSDYTTEDFSFLVNINLQSAFHLSQLAHSTFESFRSWKDCLLCLLFAVWYLSTLDTLFIQLLKVLNSLARICVLSAGGINELTRNLECEWAKDNIRVNSVAPWSIRTPMPEDVLKNENVVKELAYQTPMRRVGEPGEVSSAVAFLCAIFNNRTGHLY
ncbi:putative proteinD(P)-BINDING ROSSMANN-FOLD PROTEIN [Salix koriyanagi]|uniref:Uncharacterized protein n=1 Tax=Salix koriyanagi TaxID=2511006 RepID=A0A9Q0WKE8_9ROSI|nr:putative proteinD(P)-BINDING ROSSMANN-FOLD PROTEIN [Salix koriyanagi]